MDLNKLKNLVIKELFLSKKVFIMGHNNLDLDAFASIMGFSLICKKMRKKYYIISNDETFDDGINEALNKLKNVVIINKEKADKLIDKKSLLVILDTNKQNLICIEDINKFKTTIVIDHHEINDKTIKTDNLFINNNISSASEIVATLLRELKIKIPNYYCTLLLSGIILDTNGLSYKMNKKTFYNCYYLLSKGANMTEAEELLKTDFNDYIKNHQIIANATIEDGIAITIGSSNKIYNRKNIAIAADTLLTFRGVKFSVVIGNIKEEEIGISVRSIGEIDANKVMNLFDGGGNKTEAAAIVTNKTKEEIKEQILKFIKR